LGGPQVSPFILYPAEIELPAGAINNSYDLYPVFACYLKQAPGGPGVGPDADERA
jgi:hypothetical protein